MFFDFCILKVSFYLQLSRPIILSLHQNVGETPLYPFTEPAVKPATIYF